MSAHKGVEQKSKSAPKNILLTGGAGFIGSHVVIHLMKKYSGIKLVCLDKLCYCASLKNLDLVKRSKNFLFVKGNITNADLVQHIIKSHQIDTILHFAAQTHVDNSFGNSIQFSETNVLGTHVLLECARRFRKQIKLFVHVSTDEVYGESELESTFNDETTALAPTNPYAATKAAAEHLVKAYHKSFNVPIIITRCNNVYGVGQYPEKLIPKFIHLLQRGRKLCIHGTGENCRSYVHVSDVSCAFDTIIQHGVIGEVYNIGTSFEISNIGVARAILKLVGEHCEKDEDKYIEYVEDRAFNDRRYFIDPSKLEQLGWKPKIQFLDGLQDTIEWYKNNLNYWPEIDSALVAHPRSDSFG